MDAYGPIDDPALFSSDYQEAKARLRSISPGRASPPRVEAAIAGRFPLSPPRSAGKQPRVVYSFAPTDGEPHSVTFARSPEPTHHWEDHVIAVNNDLPAAHSARTGTTYGTARSRSSTARQPARKMVVYDEPASGKAQQTTPGRKYRRSASASGGGTAGPGAQPLRSAFRPAGKATIPTTPKELPAGGPHIPHPHNTSTGSSHTELVRRYRRPMQPTSGQSAYPTVQLSPAARQRQLRVTVHDLEEQVHRLAQARDPVTRAKLIQELQELEESYLASAPGDRAAEIRHNPNHTSTVVDEPEHPKGKKKFAHVKSHYRTTRPVDRSRDAVIAREFHRQRRIAEKTRPDAAGKAQAGSKPGNNNTTNHSSEGDSESSYSSVEEVEIIDRAAHRPPQIVQLPGQMARDGDILTYPPEEYYEEPEPGVLRRVYRSEPPAVVVPPPQPQRRVVVFDEQPAPVYRSRTPAPDAAPYDFEVPPVIRYAVDHPRGYATMVPSSPPGVMRRAVAVSPAQQPPVTRVVRSVQPYDDYDFGPHTRVLAAPPPAYGAPPPQREYYRSAGPRVVEVSGGWMPPPRRGDLVTEYL